MAFKASLRRLMGRYLVLSGVGAHVILGAAYMHYSSTGLAPHYYLEKVVQYLDGNSPTRHIAGFTREVLLDTGLIRDPVDRFPPDLVVELPPWQGAGASKFRKDTLPRYIAAGMPIPIDQHDQIAQASRPAMRIVQVENSEGALSRALTGAQAGDQFVLDPGTYTLRDPLPLLANGTAEKPIRITSQEVGTVVIELIDDGVIDVRGAYWVVSDLVVRGPRYEAPDRPFLKVANTANALVVRNIFASGITPLLAFSEYAPTQRGLVDASTLVGGSVLSAGYAWPTAAVRRVNLPLSGSDFLVLCPESMASPDCDTRTLAAALKGMKRGGLLLMRSGIYEQAGVVGHPGVHILAEPGATLYKASVRGKGALVVNADITIEGLECSHVKVPDGNGACVRQQAGDVNLIGVHFHHAQMGLLTGHKGGSIRIYDSYFHDSGYDERGNLGHNIYVSSGTLEFTRSWSVTARNRGHELKSRASQTVIRDSLLASVNARDSRLVDAPNGGVLRITGTILAEGARSENKDIIGYGLEVKGDRPRHPVNIVELSGNTVFSDRPQGARLLNALFADEISMDGNVLVGDISDAVGQNRHIGEREDAGIPPYPALPSLAY